MISPPVQLLQLYVIPHGETEWSLSHQHTGWTDIPLTQHGEEEARGLSGRLAGLYFDYVLSSPLQRAWRTCALAGLSHQVQIYPDLAEWDYGDYEGLSTTDICKKRPDWNIFHDGCPMGEMPTHVSERADRLIAHLRSLGGTIALFTHGQFGCALAARWISLHLYEAQHFSLDPASVSILGYDLNHSEVAVIIQWNVTEPVGSTKALDEVSIERWENEGGEG